MIEILELWPMINQTNEGVLFWAIAILSLVSIGLNVMVQHVWDDPTYFSETYFDMPASPIKWSAFAGPEVEQVFGLTYGTKRKTGQDGGADFEECMASEPHVSQNIEFFVWAATFASWFARMNYLSEEKSLIPCYWVTQPTIVYVKLKNILHFRIFTCHCSFILVPEISSCFLICWN